jgi:hypothetical protein
MEFLGDVGQMVAHFGPFGDRVNLDTTKCEVCVECAIGLELILGEPDGTPTWHGSSGSSFQFVWT